MYCTCFLQFSYEYNVVPHADLRYDHIEEGTQNISTGKKHRERVTIEISQNRGASGTGLLQSEYQAPSQACFRLCNHIQ